MNRGQKGVGVCNTHPTAKFGGTEFSVERIAGPCPDCRAVPVMAVSDQAIAVGFEVFEADPCRVCQTAMRRLERDLERRSEVAAAELRLRRDLRDAALRRS